MTTLQAAIGWRVGEALGFDATWAEDLTTSARAGGARPRPGRVLRTHRVGFDVATPSGREFTIHQADRRNPLTAPATGDWVVVADLPDVEDPVITTVGTRRTALIRRDPADRAVPQVLAANADVVVVVQGVDRPISARRLERQLVLAHGSGADVVVAVTKADLPDAADAIAAVRDAAPGQQVLVTAAATGEGITDLSALTDGHATVALLGESGAGKSSLLNAVVGEARVDIGGVREGDRRGRHTTTRRELHVLAGGGAVLDTPGVRAIALWPGATGFAETFPRISEATHECRFSDCSHRHEPGCAVIAGLADGTLDPDRVEAWRSLQDEVAETERQLERKDWR
ncbi:ribosome small subunit-dependent GTPase A [Euzebya tangerina]|uniref:ribosome small subunit-dependent GTPase A n=1 Tax=Euzebya tangerina TaxID=591198 RepID=UPI0013C2C2EE|nr:ribosome small subunit-dependent GTPase A [Euzebya tangerina]